MGTVWQKSQGVYATAIQLVRHHVHTPEHTVHILNSDIEDLCATARLPPSTHLGCLAEYLMLSNTH